MPDSIAFRSPTRGLRPGRSGEMAVGDQGRGKGDLLPGTAAEDTPGVYAVLADKISGKGPSPISSCSR